MSGFPMKRLRRLRGNATLRQMLGTSRLSVSELIAPIFVRGGQGQRQEIPSMPGQCQFSVDTAMETIRRWSGKGIPAVLLFGIPDAKDAAGSGAWDEQGPAQTLTRQIKKELPQVMVIADVCLCEYTDHGHCGTVIADRTGQLVMDNDATLASLTKSAISLAAAGADIVAPSAMMDGQVAAIRAGLDGAGFTETAILGYSVKFASCLYGPFRDAAGSVPQFGDRRGYQMDYRSAGQAVLEAAADAAEGADLLMVKPVATYLDILHDIRRRFDLPLVAYHVSGEYAMIKAASAAGWLEEQSAMLEITTAIKRAGADLIITYFAEQLADWLSHNRP